MPKKDSGDEALRCSFCNKSQREVKKLIAGPTVFICDECVDICLDIIAEDRMMEQQQETALPKPKEINAFLEDYVIGQELANRGHQVGVATLDTPHGEPGRRHDGQVQVFTVGHRPSSGPPSVGARAFDSSSRGSSSTRIIRNPMFASFASGAIGTGSMPNSWLATVRQRPPVLHGGAIAAPLPCT